MKYGGRRRRRCIEVKEGREDDVWMNGRERKGEAVYIEGALPRGIWPWPLWDGTIQNNLVNAIFCRHYILLYYFLYSITKYPNRYTFFIFPFCFYFTLTTLVFYVSKIIYKYYF